MKRRTLNTTFVILVAVGALSYSTATAGQSRTPAPGRVSGTVFDPNGAVVTWADVDFKARGQWRVTKTNAEGVYKAELPAGTYSVTIRAPGFCPVRRALRVEPGGAQSLDVRLKVAATAGFMKLGSEGNFRGGVVDFGTSGPCGERPPVRIMKISAQRGGAKRPAAKTPAAAKPSAKTAAKPSASAGVLNLSTQPGAVVWVDEVRRGVADAEGKLQLKLTPGRHSLRVRAKGLAERTLALLPTQRGALSVQLTKTADEAELLFQQAEEAREKGNNAGAVELYRQALKLRPRFAAAHLGLARALASQENFDEALEEVQAARRDQLGYAEASAVEGRIHRSLADPEAATAAYTRALREGRGFQPEAHTGMGLVHEDKGRHAEAVEAFRKAIAQLSDTEPILYELLARNLEKLERWKEAVAAYEKYLELAPTGSHASAINSIIDQLRQQAAEAEQQQQPPD